MPSSMLLFAPLHTQSTLSAKQNSSTSSITKLALLLALLGLSLSSFNIMADGHSSKDEVKKPENIIESHGFSRYGDLKYPKGFSHLEYVNPNAPKGGTLRLPGFGTFDTLNPYTLKGVSPFNTPGMFMYGFSELNETLLVGSGSYSPSGDEPQSAYGLLAETLRYPEDISWAEFTIRNEARFHDGHPVDSEDVLYSYETLIEKGHPRFQKIFTGIDSVKVIDASTIRVNFKAKHAHSDLLSFGAMPILPKHFWEQHDFEKSSSITPLLSGPYKIGKVDLGRRIELERVPDFWGKDLGVYKGRYNFDLVRIDFYRDQTIAFEAFKANEFDAYYEYTAKNWASAYTFPAMETGEVIKAEIAHEIPSGTQGFFFNTRRELFSDLKVRKALSYVFDFEWTNKSLFNGAYTRNTTYYPNSPFSATGIPEGEELALLQPFKDSLPPELFTKAFTQPVTDGSGKIRKQMRAALKLLKEAGWVHKDGKLTHGKNGQPFKFKMLIRQPGIQRVLLPYVKNLEKLGIEASVRLVDAAQYKNRLDQFDFDMMTFVLSQGLSPSHEQRDYFHSTSKDVEGLQNYAGVALPAVDHLLEKITSAGTRNELEIATRALDRVLLWHHFIVPNWHLNHHRLAYWNKFGKPEQQPPFKLGFENWWAK